jgi:hypothetical protein
LFTLSADTVEAHALAAQCQVKPVTSGLRFIQKGRTPGKEAPAR